MEVKVAIFLKIIRIVKQHQTYIQVIVVDPEIKSALRIGACVRGVGLPW